MMTISQAPRDGDWVLRAALLASLLVHVALVLLGMISYDAVVRALDPAHQSGPAAQNEIVAIARVVSIDHRAPAPAPVVTAPRPNAPATGRPRHVTTLAHFGFSPSAVAVPQGKSAEQLAFAAALARHKLTIDTSHDPARVPQKMKLAMDGLRKKLTRGQGIYFPTRGWREGGEDYYDASYEFIYPNGTDEKGVVPWPIHFNPTADPFFSTDPQALGKTPLPSPPPGFVPPGDLGKALRAYFPNLHFEDSDG